MCLLEREKDKQLALVIFMNLIFNPSKLNVKIAQTSNLLFIRNAQCRLLPQMAQNLRNFPHYKIFHCKSI